MFTDVNHTASDVLKHVKRQFGDEAAIQISDEDIIRWTNAGQLEIFTRSEPVKSSMTADLVANQGVYAFPDDVLKVQSLLVNGIPVKQLSSQEAEQYILDEDPARVVTGQPQIWYEWGGTFTFYPTPDYDVVGAITIQYIRRPTPITQASDLLSVPDVYYNRLVEYVMGQAYELDENFTAADMKATQFQQNLSATNSTNVQNNTYPVITVYEDDL